MNTNDNESDASRNRTEELVFWIVLASVIIILISWRIYDAVTASQIQRDYQITHGKITEYFDGERSVEGKHRTIVYSYKVDSNTFSRKVSTDIKFSECFEEITEACAKKRFWVIYSRKDPSKSLINLNIELQDETNTKFPETLEDFI